MAILILSDANLRCLKHVLMTDFEYGSSHASEALAALCRHRTYESLRSTISRFRRPPVEQIDFDNFASRAEGFGYNHDEAQFLRDIYKYIALPDRPWAICHKGDIAASNSWYYQCERNEIPFITIEEDTIDCTLRWDCISFGSEFEDIVFGIDRDATGRILFNLFSSVCNDVDKNVFYEGSCFTGKITHLSSSSATQLANYFFWFLSPWSTKVEQVLA